MAACLKSCLSRRSCRYSARSHDGTTRCALISARRSSFVMISRKRAGMDCLALLNIHSAGTHLAAGTVISRPSAYGSTRAAAAARVSAEEMNSLASLLVHRLVIGHGAERLAANEDEEEGNEEVHVVLVPLYPAYTLVPAK